MSNRKHDIERYLRGEMTAAEMHALEKEALRDPFLAEALEGIDNAGHASFLFDLEGLHKSVHQRTKARRGKIISITRWSYGIAAGLILLAASSVYIISLIQSDAKKAEIAMAEGQALLESGGAAQDTLEVVMPTTKDTQTQPVGGLQQTKPISPNLASRRAEEVQRDQQVQLSQVEQEETIDRTPQRITTAELTEYPPKPDTVVTYEREKIISVFAKPTLQVRGKVTSTETGSGLPGVNVLVKGSSTGTITDAEGNYEINVNDPNQVLTFAFIGLKTTEESVANRKEVNLQMDPDYSQLSEVVVTGMGVTDASKSEDDADFMIQFAEPKGGRQAFQEYLENKMMYPEQALKNKTQGRVTVQFTVDPNGQLSDFKILKGIGNGCDEELIRLIKEGPSWRPTKRNDKAVTDRVKVRLKFGLPNK